MLNLSEHTKTKYKPKPKPGSEEKSRRGGSEQEVNTKVCCTKPNGEVQKRN